MIRPLSAAFYFRFSLYMLILANSRVIKKHKVSGLLELFTGRLGSQKGGMAWKYLTPLFVLNTPKKLSILFLVMSCSSCSSEKQGLDELKRLCEKDAGLTIYKTVEVDGYYDDTTTCHHCWHGLIDSPFKYIEFCDFDSARHPLTNILKEHGCYRLSKVKINMGQCHVGIDKDIAKYIVEPFVSFKEKQCISVEKVEKPKSQYKYSVDSEKLWIDKSIGSLISKTILRFEDKSSGNLVARDIVYSLITENAGTGLSSSPIGCNSWYITKKRSPEYKGTRDRIFLKSVINRKGYGND